MDLQLQGKLALVSGSTAGIGLAIAEALAREGARVIVNGRTQKGVDAALAKLKGAGTVTGFAGDLATAAGVTVNCVLPGPTRSRGVEDFVDVLAKSRGMSGAEFEKEFFRSARPTSLIKRFATPAEVASMVAYVASPLASATTGAALRVDGGTVKSAF